MSVHVMMSRPEMALSFDASAFLTDDTIFDNKTHY
jgi:hypothetical protein